jgi:Nucleotidyl transferase AbiEii toxin, Type IV TA system
VANFRDRPDFYASIDAAAERLGFSAAIVEKDYWVTQALRILACDFPDDFIFKGGTSLSKGYGLIQRFSEDVDILIIKRETKGATHALMKQMARAVEEVLGSPAAVVSSETGVHRDVRVQYPTARIKTGGIPADVRLEAGIRGGPQPCEQLLIGCLLADALEQAGGSTVGFEDLQPFEVQVLHLGRTLMEKLGLVHSKLGADPSEQEASTHARHYYDIYELLGDDRALAVLRDRAEFDRILASMAEVNEWFGGGELRPAGGWATSQAFDTGNPHYRHLQRAYNSTMAELYLGPGNPPSFDVIYSRVTELSELL